MGAIIVGFLHLITRGKADPLEGTLLKSGGARPLRCDCFGGCGDALLSDPAGGCSSPFGTQVVARRPPRPGAMPIISQSLPSRASAHCSVPSVQFPFFAGFYMHLYVSKSFFF